MLGLTIFEETHPEDVSEDRRQFQRQLAGEFERCSIEKRIARKDGGHIWAQVTSSSVRDADGRFLYAVRVQHDITNRKRAERHYPVAWKNTQRCFCRTGMSCAIRRRPRGSIQSPKIGRKLKTPPRMSKQATTTRTKNEDGSCSHRMKVDTFVGTRRRNNSKYLSNSALTEAINSTFSDTRTRQLARNPRLNQNICTESVPNPSASQWR
ncbi:MULTISPECIES: PAS domain S-box protein [Bradyrhizobium]|nr:PAS domain S-box protein [Bradyrhizobium diazoefficiens]WRJ02662.1 PAS domain S-box protein [Bradyrhizobium diazoefficiens]WRJ10907.1 PAS domain S-box protein [Bradyrhizobium diazoefficiens]WRJ19178.1 PAS domain S-box protein [Bradyrhizobium diazoefficiens]WRJ27432.1 PAS domain S-box protein [Bradyrhizobium diazoefficiens]WRJ35691.1 PAS domain S-box protein [Bradyrhizobium diazoefficiens]